MSLFSLFGLGSRRLLAENHTVSGTVTKVRPSGLYAIKKPVRLYPNEKNTKFSHFIHFTYTVNGTVYTGKRFANPYVCCPEPGAKIDVYYDPAHPKRYALLLLPQVNALGW